MSQDLGQLITNVNRLVYNIDQKDSKYYEIYFDTTPKTVTLSYIDQNGQQQQLNIKNIAKINQEFEQWKADANEDFNDWKDSMDDKIDAAINNINLYPRQTSPSYLARFRKHDIPSGFEIIYNLSALLTQETELNVHPGGSNDSDNRKTVDTGFYTKKIGYYNSADENKIYILGDPYTVYINGFRIILDSRPSKLANNIINLPVSPTTGGRVDYVFIEAWVEKVVKNSSTDVFFPFGNVFYAESGTFNGCTLMNQNQTGGDYPAYLASSDGHGYYVKSDDPNITQFIRDPRNNVIVDSDGEIYQLRWRWRVAQDVNGNTHRRSSDSPTVVFAQGKLASPSTYSFSADPDDVGLDVAYHSSLSADGYVYSIPVLLISRFNSGTWTAANMAGGTNRIDNKDYRYPHRDHILEIKRSVSLNKDFDKEWLYSNTLNQILGADVHSTWEQYQADPDGDGTYTPINLFGKKLLYADGVCGNTVPFDSSLQVRRTLTSPNGRLASLDGFRSYYSDVESLQVTSTYIPNANQDGCEGAPLFAYSASSRTITIDATDFLSGGTTGDYRTKISDAAPIANWLDTNAAIAGLFTKVDITWSGLGGDTATGVIASNTAVVFGNTGSTFNVGNGSVYQAPNGVQVTITYTGSATNFVHGRFSGSTQPNTGTWNRVSGSGDASISINTVMVGYQFDVTDTPMPNTSLARYVGHGINLHSGSAIYLSAYFQFTPGSSFLSRVPYKDYNSIKGTHYNVKIGNNLIQLLPNNGKDYVPAGVHENASYFDTTKNKFQFNALDTSSKTTNLNLFLNKKEMFTSNIKLGDGTFIKVGNRTFFYYFKADINIYYRYSDDNGETWSNEVQFTNDGKSLMPCVIYDGTYRMWYGFIGTNPGIYYTTSNDGLNWATPTRVLQPGASGTGKDANEVLAFTVIKDGTTYKMWYRGAYSSYTQGSLIYCESSNGTTWSNFYVCFDTAYNFYNGFYNARSIHACKIIKEGNVYKMILGADNSLTPGMSYFLYSISRDGRSWSEPIILSRLNADLTVSYSTCVMAFYKEDRNYKLILGLQLPGLSNYQVCQAVLAMYDPNGSGTSTTGVYTTQGQLSLHPPEASQVTVYYESTALPYEDRGLSNGQNIQLEYFDKKQYYSSLLGSNRYSQNSYEIGKDFADMTANNYAPVVPPRLMANSLPQISYNEHSIITDAMYMTSDGKDITRGYEIPLSFGTSSSRNGIVTAKILNNPIFKDLYAIDLYGVEEYVLVSIFGMFKVLPLKQYVMIFSTILDRIKNLSKMTFTRYQILPILGRPIYR